MNFTALTYVLLALICIAGIVQQWMGTDISWWRLAAALLVLGLLYEWIRARIIVLRASIDELHTLRLGYRETIFLRLKNASPRSIQLSYTPTLPETLETGIEARTVTLAGMGECREAIDITPVSLGQFRWPRFPILLKGCLGLGWWPQSIDIGVQFHVGPDLAGSRRRAAGDISTGERSHTVGSGMELHHLRQYVPGDPIHKIDWKATARAQNLVTRVFSDDQHLEIMLVLDIGRTSRSYLDGLSQFSHYVNISAKFAEIAAAGGDQIGLLAVADKPLAALPPRSGTPAVVGIRYALQDLAPRSCETDLVAAAVQVQRLLKRRSLIILLTDFYGHSPDGVLARSLKLWQTRHQAIVVGLIGDEIIQQQLQGARSDRDAYTALAAREYQNNLEGNAQAVRKLGAHTVIARPGELQYRVLAEYRLLKARRQV